VLPAGPAAPAPDASLTAAEREVASLAVAGCSHAEIAARRGTSKRTVANQLGALYRKLRLASRNELINWWVAHEEPPAPSPPAAPRPGR
jgi:DNA-binding CsgD family transcriptional regulator